jgi:aspartyl-tRNA(Asn)/glutamyl-tRNA(Gln) amidotransferase subunit A
VEAARGLNAYIVETPDQARASAKASDLRLKAGTAGELEGIPLGIKDLFATRACTPRPAATSSTSFSRPMNRR